MRLSQRQLDEAVDNSSGSPTRLVRNLMSIFFSKETLATSSALGGRTNQVLDPDIIGASLRKNSKFNYITDIYDNYLICRICFVKT